MWLGSVGWLAIQQWLIGLVITPQRRILLNECAYKIEQVIGIGFGGFLSHSNTPGCRSGLIEIYHSAGDGRNGSNGMFLANAHHSQVSINNTI
jgi:hypothetical protein